MGSGATPPEVAEGVRAAIATYTQALDDGRTDDVVATFCPDGSCAIPGLGTHEGHDALRAAYAAVEPRRPQRHLVLNTLVAARGADEATAVSDVVLVLAGRPDGRSSSSAATTTSCTATATSGGSTAARPPSSASTRPDDRGAVAHEGATAWRAPTRRRWAAGEPNSDRSSAARFRNRWMPLSHV